MRRSVAAAAMFALVGVHVPTTLHPSSYYPQRPVITALASLPLPLGSQQVEGRRQVPLGPIEEVIPVPVSKDIVPPINPKLHWPKLHLGETGIVSTYGPGYNGYLALPWPWCEGWKIRIKGPGGSVVRVSNDCGPERRLHRIADLDVPTFEKVCGAPWSVGLCKATVVIIGKE